MQEPNNKNIAGIADGFIPGLAAAMGAALLGWGLFGPLPLFRPLSGVPLVTSIAGILLGAVLIGWATAAAVKTLLNTDTVKNIHRARMSTAMSTGLGSIAGFLVAVLLSTFIPLLVSNTMPPGFQLVIIGVSAIIGSGIGALFGAFDPKGLASSMLGPNPTDDPSMFKPPTPTSSLENTLKALLLPESRPKSLTNIANDTNTADTYQPPELPEQKEVDPDTLKPL